jgi:hypothetical protein
MTQRVLECSVDFTKLLNIHEYSNSCCFLNVVGVLKSTDENHIVFEAVAAELATYRLTLGPTRVSILTRVMAFLRQWLTIQYYTNHRLRRL